jgi:hypothetical protein
MSDSYTMTVEWQDTPGWRKPPVQVVAELPLIAAALKALCDSPKYGLMNLARLEVKPS